LLAAVSCKRSPCKLKLIKNDLSASTGQERLTNRPSMSILFIENEITNNINLFILMNAIIDEFALLKAGKVQ